MQHLVFRGVGELGWEETEAPVIQDDRDALVRPIAVARCDLDTAIAIGLYPMQPPFTMGHEMVGEIVEAGEKAGDWNPGDRVIVPFQISCGECSMCRRGLTNACESVPLGAAFGLAVREGMDFGGALSDLVRVPWADHMLLPLPDAIGRLQAFAFDFVPGKPFSSDNFRSLLTDSVGGIDGLHRLGIDPTTVGAMLPGILGHATDKQSRYARYRAAR